MTLSRILSGACQLVAALSAVALQAAEMVSAPVPQRILIANDTCPDVTWGFTETQVRQAFADLLAAHLDEMNRTDAGPPESRNHYSVMAFVEVEAFLEKFPGRREEFLRCAREGRVCVGPFLCNTLWGFQSVEGALRAFYPARRMERDHGISLDVANHTELPSLPWGMATVLADCGFRWVSVPFLDYDCTFKGLKNPPLFRLEGPDGSEVRVVMDAWASLKANYMQGGWLLQDTKRIAGEWLPHYQELGSAWPLHATFASGTHSDINPNSWKQARGFVEAIAQYNAAGTNPVKLVNGTLAQFCREVDTAQTASPFLPKLRGSFGHSWELWPVSQAGTVAALRNSESAFLAAESLVTLASQANPALATRTRADREKAEWCWAMLGDHAWNGTDLNNKHHNADLRRHWAAHLAQISQQLTGEAWRELGLKANPNYLTIFNPLSFANDVLVTCEAPSAATGVRGVASELRVGEGQRQLVFVAPRVPPFGFREFRFETKARPTAAPPFSGSTNSLENQFYRLRVDPQNGGVASLVHKASGQELVDGTSGRALCQTVFFDGQERPLTGVECRAQFDGFATELRVTGRIVDILVTNLITLYATLDRVDFDTQISKPPTTNEQRLLHFFPVGDGFRDLRIETTAAVIRPAPQPEGDLLPGADTRRFAVQGFVDASPAGRVGVTIAPLDAFMLRLDQGALAFEALGNDQNWKEVIQDQAGAKHFRFRYSLRAHPPGYDNAAALAWSRSVSAPPTIASGRLPGKRLNQPNLAVDPARALVTCWKPADDGAPGQAIVRLWETCGQTGPLTLELARGRGAWETDLLERERGALPFTRGKAVVQVRGHGFAAVRVKD